MLELKQLFKYMSKPRDLFERGFLRLSQPTALNDPFEALFCRESLEELASHFDDSTALDPEYGETSFSQYIENRMHQIGVISFSENKENLLMWAHYADEHRGIVAGVAHHPNVQSIFSNLFRADSLINSSLGEEWSPFDGIPKPVSYRKGLRYRNDKFDYDYSNISVEGLIASFTKYSCKKATNGFMSKSTELFSAWNKQIGCLFQISMTFQVQESKRS